MMILSLHLYNEDKYDTILKLTESLYFTFNTLPDTTVDPMRTSALSCMSTFVKRIQLTVIVLISKNNRISPSLLLLLRTINHKATRNIKCSNK